jgi:futalosine hydrolase
MRVFNHSSNNRRMDASFPGDRYTLHFRKQQVKGYVSPGWCGMLANAVALTKLMYEEKPDLILQVGIAGCFDTNIMLGNVVGYKGRSVRQYGCGRRW